MQLTLAFLFVVALVSIDGVPLRLNVQNSITQLAFPTDRESLLSLLSQNDPSKVLVSMLMGVGADPNKVTAIIVLLDDLILKAQEGHNGVVDAKADAALLLDQAITNLHTANVALKSAEDDVTAANQRKDAASADSTARYANAQAELSALEEVRAKLQHLLNINTNDAPVEPNFISAKSQTEDVSPKSLLGSINLLTILQKADPTKLQAVIDSVDELISSCQASMKGMDDEVAAASAALIAAQEQKETALAAQQVASDEKDRAQIAYDDAITNLTGKEKRELELLEQVKLLLMGLLPGANN